jgi:hypothetical protein
MASAATRSYFPRIIHRRRRNAPKSHSGRFPIGAGASAGKGGNRSRVPRRPQGDGRGVAVARGSTPRLSELPQMPRSSKLKGLISFRRSKRLKLERGRCAQSAALKAAKKLKSPIHCGKARPLEPRRAFHLSRASMFQCYLVNRQPSAFADLVLALVHVKKYLRSARLRRRAFRSVGCFSRPPALQCPHARRLSGGLARSVDWQDHERYRVAEPRAAMVVGMQRLWPTAARRRERRRD